MVAVKPCPTSISSSNKKLFFDCRSFSGTYPVEAFDDLVAVLQRLGEGLFGVQASHDGYFFFVLQNHLADLFVF